jgi:hypothetical protein
VDIHDFQLLFGASIKAWLSWERLLAADATVHEEILAERESVGSLLTVWYTNKVGGPSDWRDSAAIVQSIADVVGNRGSWPEARGKRIDFFQSMYAGSNEPAILTVPAYKVPAGNLLLDSTHRVAALYRAAIDARVLVLTINGPVTGQILPDLTHHKDREV